MSIKCYTTSMEKPEKKKAFWHKLVCHFVNKDKKEKNSNDKKLYSNSANTVVKIKNALLQLLSQNKLTDISITNLVKLAGIYRATFYLHYRNINEIVDDIQKDIFDRYNNIKEDVKDIDLYKDMDRLINIIGEYLEQDKEYMQAIISTKTFGSLAIQLIELANITLNENFARFEHFSRIEDLNTKIAVFTGALVWACRDWAKGDSDKFATTGKYLADLGKELFNN